jgi:hypothetical protein
MPADATGAEPLFHFGRFPGSNPAAGVLNGTDRCAINRCRAGGTCPGRNLLGRCYCGTLVLLFFGAGMGFAVVSPRGHSGVSATTFEIGTGLYFIVTAMISSAIGGYLAGRLRTKWIGVQTTEVLFRDTAHGFLAWAAASVLGAVLLASPASSLIGGALSGAKNARRYWRLD